jgi:2-polyprenyl-3-methyl-5-hydroxy-6-metoxy-1,4-benzoquinol methylase
MTKNEFLKTRAEDAIDIATEKCLRILEPADLGHYLSDHCPGLLTFDFANYLRCSKYRLRHIYDKSRSIAMPEGEILDYGSWLGNFALAFKFFGFSVTACEFWNRYAPSLDPQKKLLADHEIDCIDTVVMGSAQKSRFAAVLLAAVIEHIADSPRALLRQIHGLLKPGGILFLDTPNIAYIYNRRRLARGLSIHPPIIEQFFSAVPFEGHVREYTGAELTFMLENTGFEVLHLSYFNYSMYGVRFPRLMNARSLLPMWISPEKRELIFVIARKK